MLATKSSPWAANFEGQLWGLGLSLQLKSARPPKPCRVRQVLELDPADAAMKKIVKRLEPIVEERREMMKEEMMGVHHGPSMRLPHD